MEINSSYNAILSAINAQNSTQRSVGVEVLRQTLAADKAQAQAVITPATQNAAPKEKPSFMSHLGQHLDTWA